MTKRAPGRIAAPVLDWRARNIADPVARLRFLRAAHRSYSLRFRPRHVIVTAAMLLAGSAAMPFRGALSASHNGRAPAARPVELLSKAEAARIWQVESTKDYEDYSNGLRIEKQFATPNRPRPKYRVFERAAPSFEKSTWREGVAGIVFHTTESHIAPFHKDANDRLRRAGRNLLAEVQINRSYHYVVDRFGRVWRIVEESDVAWHAGKSIWADATGVYVNLNDSFLGISFEAQTYGADGQAIATEPQIHAAKLLTDMLRAKYSIPAGNCATHAQVSVSAASMRVAYHTDWAGNFPYAALGLPDNYAESLPSMWTFGFDYDQILLKLLGGKPWHGMVLAEQHIREQAALASLPVAQYKLKLQQRYKQLIAALYSADEEQANES